MRSRWFTGMVISVLLIVVLLLVFTDPWSTLQKDSKHIALKDPARIDRIILSDLFDSTLLIKLDQTWLLSGQEEANQVAVENLLFAAERLQINSIVSGDHVDNRGSVKTIEFMEGEKVVLAYQCRSFGEMFMVSPAGSDHNFSVSISGYPERSLDKVFSNNANHYRKHLLIDLLPSEIAGIDIELASGQAFKFAQDKDGEISCFPANNETQLPSGFLDDISTRLLFSYFTAIRYEQGAGISSSALKTAGVHNSGIATIHVRSFQGETHTLEVFPYHENQGAEAHMFRALVCYNSNPEALVVNYIYLDVLMRDLSHYFGEK